MQPPIFPWEVEPKDLLYRSEAGTWITEASQLGFPVGQWPKELLLIHVEGGPYLVPFASQERDADGDIRVTIYRSQRTNPITIHVLND